MENRDSENRDSDYFMAGKAMYKETINGRCPYFKLSQRKATKVLLRQIFSTEVDLEPDTKNNILNVSLHSLSNEKSNKTAINLCKQLNETATVFPGTELRLSYKLVSM